MVRLRIQCYGAVCCVLWFGGCGDGVMVLFVVCEFDKCWRDLTDIG